MKKIKVLYISSWYPSKEHPTLGNFVQKHAEAVQPHVDLEVLYITSSSTDSIEHSVINNVSTTLVYYKKITSKIPLISNLLKYKKSMEAFDKGLDYLEKERGFSNFDLVHCNVSFPAGYFALELKRRNNVPYILTEHWTAFTKGTNGYENFSYLTKKAIQQTVKEASLLLTVSESLKNDMARLGLKQNTEVIPNVVDCSLFIPLENKDNKRIKILHVSTMDKMQKNASGILNVIKKISEYRNDFVLHVVSDDNFIQTEDLINKLQISKFVQLERTKTTAEIVSDFQTADFFLLFSNYETFSVVLAESWSCGIPAVYSNCGGLTAINNSDLGVQVEMKNELELEKAIVNLLDNHKNYKSDVIRKFAVDNFDKKAIGVKIFDSYRAVLSMIIK